MNSSAQTTRSYSATLLGAAFAVAARPDLWWVALRQTARSIPSRWWTSWPFLPIPSRKYIHFRLVTAYGGEGRLPSGARGGEDLAQDLVAWLEWCKA